MKQSDIDWSRRHFASLKDGATWGVPRSGLLFNRRGNELVLVARMPWTAEMPVSAEELKMQQDADVEVIKAHFEAAGVTVLER